MPTYYALTIGPVYETLRRTRETRELWAASYTFSYLVKQFIKELEASGFNVISPFDDKIQNTTGTGLFPDRLYCEEKNGNTFEKFQISINKVIENFANLIFVHLDWKSSVHGAITDNIFKYEFKSPLTGVKPGDIIVIQKQLISYLKLYTVSCTIEGGNPILLGINNMLETLELNSKVTLQTDQFFLDDFWFRANDCQLVQDAFGDKAMNGHERKYWHFPSLFEIASTDIEKKAIHLLSDKKKVESIIETFNKNHFGHVHTIERKRKTNTRVTSEELQKVSEYLKEFKSKVLDKLNIEIKNKQIDQPVKDLLSLKPAHKYFAIVYADGDGVGKALNALKSVDQITEFSQKLFNFSIDAANIINDYGGVPIYIGGDDILFFAPVISNDIGIATHIMELIQKIDKKFSEYAAILSDISGEDVSSFNQSYGITISYFKFPLYESMNMAFNNLMFKAKNMRLNPKKNSVVVSMQKHSGQKWEFTLLKDSASDSNYNQWMNFVNNYCKGNHPESTFLNSLTHRIEMLHPIFNSAKTIKDGIKSFFKKSFNDEPHKNNNFIEDLGAICQHIYQLDCKKNSQMECLDKKSYIYSMLRYLDFINKEKED